MSPELNPPDQTGAHGTETFYCNNTYNSNDTHLNKYAQNIHDNMVEFGLWDDNTRRDNKAHEDNDPEYGLGFHLGVLDELKVPNCLSEIGFVDNPNDRKKLESTLYRWRFAQGYLEGLKAAFNDLSIASIAIEETPCFADNDNLFQLSIAVTNNSDKNYSGDLKVMLREFPMYIYDEPSTDFCQVGDNRSIFLLANQTKTYTFSNPNIPVSDKVGMALCFESRGSSDFYWKKVPVPYHREIIKIPLNAATIQGTVFDNLQSPLSGAEIWSYQYSTNKSFELGKTNNLDYYPTRAISNNNGDYEILIPDDWNEAVVSFLNYYNYDEKLVSPIEDRIFSHYYTTSPIIINIGSGTSVDCAGYVGSNPGNPIEIYRPIDEFQNITINGQVGIACVGKNDNITLGVSPKPVNYSKYFSLYCDGGYTYTNVFYSKIDCNLDWERSCDCIILFFGCDCDWIVEYWIYLTKLDNDLNPVGSTISRKMKYIEYNGDQSIFDLGPFLIENVSVNEAVSEAIEQNGGGLYRMKIGYNNEWDDWVDKSVDVFLIPDDLVLNNTIESGTYDARNILVENSTVNSNVNLIATNRITIKKKSRFTGPFHASKNDDFNSYCNTKSGSSEVIDENNKDRKETALISSDYDRNGMILPNRTVSELSDNCSCKKNLFLDDEDELRAEGISIFPSPVSTELNININNNNQSQIEIYNLEGQLVEIMQTKEDENIFDVTNYQNGIYVIKIIKSVKTIVAKFIKTS
jgi:hypothetical protein